MQVKSLMSCFQCEADLSAVLDDHGVVACPRCGAENGPGVSDTYQEPYYVSEQLARLKDVDQWEEFIKNRRQDKIIACARETYDTLTMINHVPMTSEEMKELVGICKNIGTLAFALEDSFAAGAKYKGRIEKEEPNESNPQDEVVRQRPSPEVRSPTKRR